MNKLWEKYAKVLVEYSTGVKKNDLVVIRATSSEAQPLIKEIYKQRSQHIERIFADGKMKYGLRYTYFRGKERVHRELTLLYACMNLKKFALHHYV